jgi:hypothetical protein
MYDNYSNMRLQSYTNKCVNMYIIKADIIVSSFCEFI